MSDKEVILCVCYERVGQNVVKSEHHRFRTKAGVEKWSANAVYKTTQQAITTMKSSTLNQPSTNGTKRTQLFVGTKFSSTQIILPSLHHLRTPSDPYHQTKTKTHVSAHATMLQNNTPMTRFSIPKNFVLLKCIVQYGR